MSTTMPCSNAEHAVSTDKSKRKIYKQDGKVFFFIKIPYVYKNVAKTKH